MPQQEKYVNWNESQLLERMSIQYVTDEEGRHKAVIIPIEEWEEMKREHQRIKSKLEVFKGIEDALQEVEDIKGGRRKRGRTLGEFLNEV
jgi:PHD/YefM family antitoxin component YafN of YafNO toxin-antitoxin module